MSDKPMTQREIEALNDIAGWRGHVYSWKPASMRKLAERGYVEFGGTRGGVPSWKITEAGLAACRAMKEAGS